MSIVIDGPPPGGPSPPEGTFVGANLQKTAEGIDLARHFVEPGNGKLAYPMSSSGTPGGHLVNLTVRTLDKKEHHMSVAHDIPVPQLKTEVASITSIDAESQRLVSGGEEMSLDGRLSDYCASKSHVIYLVVRFPGVSYVVTPQGHDTEDVEVEPATSTAVAEVSTRTNPRIVLRGTVTIPVPERDVHRVVHSLLGSQTNLSDFVSSMAYNQPGQSWSRSRRGAGATRPRMQRGRQAQARRSQAPRAGGQRSGGQRNSVNVSFRGSEWESMRVWPQSIDFQAGFGDDFMYDSLEDNNSDGFRLHYSSGSHRRISRTGSEGEESATGRDESLSSLFEGEDSGNHDFDDSYLSGNQTMLAGNGGGDDGYFEHSFDGLNYSGTSLADEEDWDETELESYDMNRIRHNELPLGRITGKRKYAEMCNSPANPHRSAPRSRSMAPDLPASARLPVEPEYQMRANAAVADVDECDTNDENNNINDSPMHWGSLSSPNVSASIGSPPGGASPDSAEACSPLVAAEFDVRHARRGAHHTPVCHFELPPNRGEGGDALVASGGVSTSASTERANAMLPRTASNDWAEDEMQGAQGGMQLAAKASGDPLAAKASGDPLAAAEIHGIDTEMASLSLQPQLVSQPQLVDAAKAGRAVYKTHPEPLVEVVPDVPHDATSPGSVWSQRNSCDSSDKPVTVKKNQCCVVM